MSNKISKLIVLPVGVFLASLIILLYNFSTTGEFVLRDIDLKGGTLITLETSSPVDTASLEKFLDESHGSVFVSGVRSATGNGIKVEADQNADVNQIVNDIEGFGVTVNSFSAETLGSFLGNLFFQQVVYIIAIGFILMSIVIFLIYRNPVTSFGIVFAILANIIVTLAITTLLGIKISFAGFAGILMLIAYTVDTNIVLTHNALKSTPENLQASLKKAFSTGITLTATITATMVVVYLLSTSKLLVNISQILVIGFITDLMFTWIFNSAILEWWINRRYGQ